MEVAMVGFVKLIGGVVLFVVLIEFVSLSKGFQGSLSDKIMSDLMLR
jgi:hypothetical protein